MLFGVSVRHKARSAVRGPVDATDKFSHVQHIVTVVEKMAVAIHTRRDVEMEAVESQREFDEAVDHDEEDSADLDDVEEHYLAQIRMMTNMRKWLSFTFIVRDNF